MTTGTLTPLVISGAPTDTELSEAWNDIFTDYCDMTTSKSQTYVLQLVREIKGIELQLEIMQICVDRLSVSYHKKACDILTEYGFNYAFTRETMLEDVKQMVVEAQYLVVQLGVKKGEYDKYLASNTEKETTEKDFNLNLATLSKFQGYQLRSKDLSVSEYVAIFNSFKEQNGG